jgi:hypothetical protein
MVGSMKINAEWHRAHRMPKNATPQQRLQWHLAHAKACSCRPLTTDMLERLRKAASAK